MAGTEALKLFLAEKLRSIRPALKHLKGKISKKSRRGQNSKLKQLGQVESCLAKVNNVDETDVQADRKNFFKDH